MSQLLYRLGHFAARRPWLTIGAWLALAVLVVGASQTVGKDLEDSFSVPGTDSFAATELLAEQQPDRAGLTAQIVVTPADEGATFSSSAAARAALAEVQAAAAGLPHALGTNNPSGQLAGVAGADRSVSDDGRVALIRVRYPVVEELSATDLDNVKALREEYNATGPLRVEAGGDLFFVFEEPQTGVGEIVGILVAVVILLVAFGSVIAMGLPVGMALFGLALGISGMSLIAYVIEVPSWAPQMAAMIGIGVGIDYALLLVTRHRGFLARGLGVEESVGRAVATAGQSVVFAGSVVIIAILGLSVAGIPFLTAGAVATSVIVLIMVLGSVTLIPALLGLAKHRISGRRRRARDANAHGAVTPRWRAWGSHVAANAWTYAMGTILLLLLLAAPVLALRVGFIDDGTLPVERTERRAYDLVAAGFGPGTNGPLVVAVEVGGDPGAATSLATAVENDSGVASVSPIDSGSTASVATFLAFPTTAPQDDATLDTLRRLRGDVVPAVLGESTARAHIGGQTATWIDLGSRVGDRLPWFIAAVIGLSLALLTLVFRSVVVPIKAALLNLLSIGAAYGVLVMVFQWGWGASLIGLESTVPILSFIPLFMFAVVFGLSMDYEVFLLSRIREAYLASGDNVGSVVHGIASTARVITSAALIMISVFLGFVFGDDPTIKMLGLGLATAIFVDATLVRMILLPATMTLLGDANWWLPRRLDRLLPAIDIDGAQGAWDARDEQEPVGDPRGVR